MVPGRGGGFSLEAPEGLRFLTRSRLFTEEENSEMEAAGPPRTGPQTHRQGVNVSSSANRLVGYNRYWELSADPAQNIQWRPCPTSRQADQPKSYLPTTPRISFTQTIDFL